MPKKHSNRQSSVDAIRLASWFLHEFGFASLLLLFSFGALSIGLGFYHYQHVRSLAFSNLAAANQECPLPSTPRLLSAVPGIEAGSVQLAWELLPNVDNYVVVVHEQIENTEEILYQAGSGNEYLVRGLEPGSMYTTQIAGENSCGIGTFTAVSMVQAQSYGTEPTGIAQRDIVAKGDLSGLTQTIDRSQSVRLQNYLFERGFWFMVGGIVLFVETILIAWYGLHKMQQAKKKQTRRPMGLGYQ